MKKSKVKNPSKTKLKKALTPEELVVSYCKGLFKAISTDNKSDIQEYMDEFFDELKQEEIDKLKNRKYISEETYRKVTNRRLN